MTEGFLTSIHTAELFFRICSRFKVQSREDRTCLMRELTKRKKVKYLRNVEEIVQGKNVLRIGFKPPHNPWDEHYCPECGPKETR